MKYFMWLLKWILKAAIFFALLAFALNNQQEVTVAFFPGRQWQAPLVAVVLGSFALGIALGALGMMPHWWRQRRLNRPAPGAAAPDALADAANSVARIPDGH
jgi:putative membrane protein